jgi:hypothetical protein
MRERQYPAPDYFRRQDSFSTEVNVAGSPHGSTRTKERSMTLSHNAPYRQQQPTPDRSGIDGMSESMNSYNGNRRPVIQVKRVVTEPLLQSIGRTTSPASANSSTSSFSAAQQYCEQMQAHMLKSRNGSAGSSIDGGISSGSDVGEPLDRIDSARNTRAPPPPPPRKKRPPPPPPVRQASLMCAGAGGYQ